MESTRASTLLVTVLTGLCTHSLVASADEPAPRIAPAVLASATQPAPSIPESSEPLRVFGGIFLGLSSASAVAATIVGASSTVSLCIDCDGGDSASAPPSFGSNTNMQIATGLAIGAAVTAAIGIPMVVAGTNQAHAPRKTVQLGFAPTLSQHASGALSSLTVRF